MKYINKLFLVILVLSFGACTDLDDIDPINSIPTDAAINNLASAEAAVNGVYSAMQGGSFDTWLSLAQYFSDECDFTGTFPTRLEFANFNVFPANGTMAGAFSGLYTVINNANTVEARLPLVTDVTLTPELLNNFVAEARFVRAYCYLHLTMLFGDVPLVLTPTVEVGDVLNVPNSTRAAIISQVIADATFAEENLTGTNPARATVASASALIARASLYSSDNATALSKAEEVIAGVDLTTRTYLEDIVFSLNYTSVDGNSLGFFYAPASLGGRHSIEPSATLRAAYEEGDIRRDLSIDDAGAIPFGTKYDDYAAAVAGSGTDPLLFIRFGEVFLIAAEAAAQTGDFAKANTYYNQVRARAGLAEKTLDSGNFIDLILAERFVELAMEGPHRLIDLRRTGKALDVLGPLGYESCDDFWPLPQRDIDRNPNLQQNACCNC